MGAYRDIVVTGVGVVSPIGVDRAPVVESLRTAKSGIRRISRFDASAFASQAAGEVRDFDGKDYIRPRKSMKVMCREIQFGVAAADMAWNQAGLAHQQISPERIGVVMGAEIMYSDLEDPAPAYSRCIAEKKFDFSRWGPHGMAEIFPLWMLKYLPNMTACHIGIALDARGPNNTVDQIEVSSLLAIAEGASLIERGLVDVAIVGGSSSRLNPAVFVWRNNEFAAKEAWPDEAHASRPFDASRSGGIHAEGAAVFILEKEAAATARRQPVLAKLLSVHHAFEPPQNGVYGRLTGSAVRYSIRAALQHAGAAVEDVHHVNAHATGHRLFDAVEAKAIHRELEDTPVTALKSYLGNSGAAGGALEMACDLLTMREGFVAPHCAFTKADPDCPVNVVVDQPLPFSSGLTLKLSQAVTGQSSTLLFETHASKTES